MEESHRAQHGLAVAHEVCVGLAQEAGSGAQQSGCNASLLRRFAMLVDGGLVLKNRPLALVIML